MDLTNIYKRASYVRLSTPKKLLTFSHPFYDDILEIFYFVEFYNYFVQHSTFQKSFPSLFLDNPDKRCLEFKLTTTTGSVTDWNAVIDLEITFGSLSGETLTSKDILYESLGMSKDCTWKIGEHYISLNNKVPLHPAINIWDLFIKTYFPQATEEDIKLSFNALLYGVFSFNKLYTKDNDLKGVKYIFSFIKDTGIFINSIHQEFLRFLSNWNSKSLDENLEKNMDQLVDYAELVFSYGKSKHIQLFLESMAKTKSNFGSIKDLDSFNHPMFEKLENFFLQKKDVIPESSKDLLLMIKKLFPIQEKEQSLALQTHNNLKDNLLFGSQSLNMLSMDLSKILANFNNGLTISDFDIVITKILKYFKEKKVFSNTDILKNKKIFKEQWVFIFSEGKNYNEKSLEILDKVFKNVFSQYDTIDSWEITNLIDSEYKKVDLLSKIDTPNDTTLKSVKKNIHKI